MPSRLEMKDVRLGKYMKMTTILISFLLIFYARGMTPALVLIILTVPLWLLTEKIVSDTASLSLWRYIEDKEDFSRLPLADDIKKMKGAKEGQKVKQAILEGRLKDQVSYTLKDEYNLSEKEIEILYEDPESMEDKVDNKKLLEFLKKARDLNDLKKPDGEDQIDLFSDGKDYGSRGKKREFEERITSAVEEIEKIQNLGEDRGDST